MRSVFRICSGVNGLARKAEAPAAKLLAMSFDVMLGGNHHMWDSHQRFSVRI